MNQKKILYITHHNSNSKGVTNKINGFTNTAINFGYEVENYNAFSANSFFAYFRSMKIIVTTNAKYIVFRSMNALNIFFCFHFLLARIQGKNLIIDIPTPMKAYTNELIHSGAKKYKIWIYLMLCYINGPWTFWIFNKVIQYGNESLYFKLGNRRKTIKIGNGIDKNTMPLRKNNNEWPARSLNLVGVAQVSYYHGFDRVIRAISHWNSNTNRKYDIIFNIIGDGQYLTKLKQQVTETKLDNFVFFHGLRDLDFIYEFYSKSHLAVSTLGLYRINLHEASVLKSREYCLAGIPFISTGTDPDFPKEIPFRINIRNDNSIDELIQIFDSYSTVRSTFSNEDVRAYALKHLTFDKKIKQIGFQPISQN